MQTKKQDQHPGKKPDTKSSQRPEDAEQQRKNATNQHLGEEREDDEEGIEDDEPVLDEQDLEENHLSDEEADNIEWEPKKDPNKQQR